MAYINNYKPPVKPVIEIKTDEPIDLNFCLPIPSELSSERVKLVPFVSSLHATQLLDGVSEHPELYKYLPYGPFNYDNRNSLDLWFEERIRGDPATLLFAIIDKTKPAPASYQEQGGPLAGVMGFLNTSPEHLSTEIGHVLVFPAWHRTFLNTNAVALLLIHGLEVPDPSRPNGGGWGLRRVQWQAHHQNAPSIRAAERMGMKLEGYIRWQRTMAPRDISLYDSVDARPGDPVPQRPGRHSALLAMCWDHYDRTELQRMMARTQ